MSPHTRRWEVRHIRSKGTDMNFADWLLAQTHRDDAVGDLARDFAEPGPHDVVGASTVDDVRAELDDYNADPAAYRTLDEAAVEWRLLHCSPSLSDLRGLLLEIHADIRSMLR